MSKIYQLTKQIHEKLSTINQKYDLKINVDSDRFMFFDELNDYREYSKETDHSDAPDWFLSKLLGKIEAPQIRQILLGIKHSLGKNPEVDIKERLLDWALHNYNKFNAPHGDPHRLLLSIAVGRRETEFNSTPWYLAEALCTKWLDGLEPMIDNEYEVVLTELLEILRNLNSK